MAYYLGKRLQGDLILFQSTGKPTRQSTAERFFSAIGPFATRLGASYYARFGHANSCLCTCADAERLAHEDPNPLWQVIREQIEVEMTMTEEELAETLQCESEEYEPDRLRLHALPAPGLFRQAHVKEELHQD
jgi:hypothetical protein